MEQITIISEGQRRKTGAVKQNQLHIHNSTTVNTQTIFKIQNDVTQLLPWGGSTPSLAPTHTQQLRSLCMGGTERRDSRAGSREGNQPSPVPLLASLSHVAASPFTGT